MYVSSKAEAILPDQDALILVYCRSRRRSKIATDALDDLRYTNVKKYCDINDWPYDILK